MYHRLEEGRARTPGADPRAERALLTYSAQELAQVPGDFTPSPFVEQITGVDNVCERAALASGGTLLRKKTTRDGVTVALAMEELHLTWKEHL